MSLRPPEQPLPDEKDRDAAPPARIGRSRGRRALLALGAPAALLIAGFFAGFLAFIDLVSRQDTEFGAEADAVVALTGGADRISDALSILAEGRAQRLLITGVHPQTSEATLIRQSGQREFFACCVDIDRQALNTVGNAREAALWAARRGYRRLLLVTSGYHMPRALIEMRRHAPEILIIPHPVISESARPDNWSADSGLARLLFVEYAKFLAASVRRWLQPRAPLT